nr:HWE histidine kinase domain-containing protein [Roseomonas marmotae]
MARRRTRDLHLLNSSLEERVRERTAEIQASEARVRLLAREVDHRAKNALSVALATLRLTPQTDLKTYVKAVEGRVTALARAHTLLAEDRWRGASLHALLKAELQPFIVEGIGATGPRATLDGPPVVLPPVAAQPLAMAAHELATNAVKHGALSAQNGLVTITWQLVPEPQGSGTLLRLRWVESNGPRVPGPPRRRSFGSRVLLSIVQGQLQGQITNHWEPAGLICEIEVPLSRLSSNLEDEGNVAAA